MLTTETLFRISQEVGASASRVEATVSLLEGGATVPFIARYRKEATGNLDEVKIQDIDECRLYYTALEQRREAILASIQGQGKLTDELKQKIEGCYSKGELEDLYLPYKPKRRTKAGEAMRLGLGPLADYIWEQTGNEPVGVYAERFISPPEPEAPTPAVASVVVEPVPVVVEAVPEEPQEPVEASAALDGTPEPLSDLLSEPAAEGPSAPAAVAEEVKTESRPAPARPTPPKPALKRRIDTVEEAIDGALHILAERVSENADFRKQLRDKLMLEGIVRAAVVPGKETGKTKYEMYYKFEETVPKIPSHRILAIRRGTRENVLSYTIDTDSEKFITTLLTTVIRDSASQFAPFLERAVRDGYERLMLPSIRNEARTALRERAEEEAIKVFEDNLRTLLLSPPAGPIGVIGIDPGIRTGCKVAVVDASGKFAENQVLQLSDPSKDLEGAEKILTELVQKHYVRAITIGNGTFSREAEAFAAHCGSKERPGLFCCRRERSWCVGVFRIQASARGISRTGRDCPWCDLDCPAPAGSSCRACED